MKESTKLKLETFALAACLFATAANLKAQTGTNSLPTVDIRATDPYALEGTSTGSFTLIRHGTTNDALAVGLNFAGTGSNGVDYAAIKSPVTIPAGFLAVDIPVTPLVVNTGNKTVVLELETNATYDLGRHHRAKVTIIDDTFNDPRPTVTLTTPTNGSTYLAPATVTLTATADDPDFAISSVSFFANDFLLGRATNSPYSLTVTNVHAGKYFVFARAEDSAGQSGFSPTVDITVTNAPGTNKPPFPVFGFR